MPRIYTLGTKAIMASGYKKGKEEKRRYDQEFAEDVKNKRAERAIAAFKANTEARKTWQEGKALESESATKTKKNIDSDSDGKMEYTPSQLSSSSISSSAKLKQDFENPTDEQNADAYKNSLFKRKADYKFKTNQWRSK